MRHFGSVQCLRGVAAMLVFMTHLMKGGFGVGGVGVDIFFIISGFIMGTVGVAEKPGSFLVKRLIRVAPLYWLVTSVMCLGAALGLFSKLTIEPTQLLRSIAFIPYFDADGQIFPILVPGWTLNYEMYFYAVFAAGLLIGRPIMFATIALSLAVGAGVLGSKDAAPWIVWTSPLLLEFLAGLLLSQFQWWPGRVVGFAVIGLGIVLLFAGAWLDVRAWDLRFLTWGVPAFLLVSGCIAIERDGWWPAIFQPLETLGDASYSLYLWHTLAIAAASRVMGESLPVKVLVVAGTIAFAYASFRLFEKPVGRWLSRIFVRKRLPASLPLFNDVRPA